MTAVATVETSEVRWAASRAWMFVMCTSTIGVLSIRSASSNGTEWKLRPAGLMTTAAPSRKASCTQSTSSCSAFDCAKKRSKPSSPATRSHVGAHVFERRRAVELGLALDRAC